METKQLFEAARRGSVLITEMTAEDIDRALLSVADAVEAAEPAILEANAADCARMDPADPRYDRLRLTPSRMADIVRGIRDVAALPSPVGKVLDRTVRPNGMTISRVTVPFGVIGVIFEARPNVAFDVFALCFKAGSACILKGGHEAAATNEAALAAMRAGLESAGAPAGAITLLGNDHADTLEMLRARGIIDLVIPRGSRRLIDFVDRKSVV